MFFWFRTTSLGGGGLAEYLGYHIACLYMQWIVNEDQVEIYKTGETLLVVKRIKAVGQRLLSCE